MGTEAQLQSILASFPFRDSPTRQLFQYLNTSDSNRILAYGPRATGKTSIVEAVAKQFGLFHAWVNVLHYASTRNIYQSILKQLKLQLVDRSDSEDIEDFDTACVSSIQFIDKLGTLLGYFRGIINTEQHNGLLETYQKKLFIVLDNADSIFKDDNSEFIYLMNYLEELVGTHSNVDISVVYISMQPGEWVSRRCESRTDFLEIVFSNYTIQELQHLLSQRALADTDYSTEFYSNYVNLILKAFIPFTRNFVELQNICLSNFEHYTKPIEEDELSAKDSAKLYLRIQPKLQEIIANLHDHKVVRTGTAPQLSPSMSYLLVAAYLASYNSTKSDKRHFVRNQGRIRGRRRKTIKHVDNEVESKAPKPFTFERLFHIYQALLNLNENSRSTRQHLLVSSVVFQQFTELIKQNLILAISSTGNSAPISSISRYLLSDSVTSKLIKSTAASIQLKLSAFIETV